MPSYEFDHGDPTMLELVAGADKTAGQVDVFGAANLPIVWTKAVANTKRGPAKFRGKVYVSVHAYGESADEAVTAGDRIYLDSTELNKDETNGTFWGIACEALGSGLTDEIEVLLGGVDAGT